MGLRLSLLHWLLGRFPSSLVIRLTDSVSLFLGVEVSPYRLYNIAAGFIRPSKQNSENASKRGDTVLIFHHFQDSAKGGELICW
jgi:hypothetical protein